jgi:hypothetical protein
MKAKFGWGSWIRIERYVSRRTQKFLRFLSDLDEMKPLNAVAASTVVRQLPVHLSSRSALNRYRVLRSIAAGSVPLS